MLELENKDICKKCGGKCCKHCGCLWFPQDFKCISVSEIEKVLESGSTSIVATPNVTEYRGRLYVVGLILTLRARNAGRNMVDLISLPNACASLTENGCKFDFDNRPSGGKHLIPVKDMKSCYEDFVELEIEKQWAQYNNVLSRIVRRITGRSVMEEYKKEVLEYLYSWCSLSQGEILRNGYEEMQEVTNLLVHLFPDEAKKVINRLEIEGQTKILKR